MNKGKDKPNDPPQHDVSKQTDPKRYKWHQSPLTVAIVTGLFVLAGTFATIFLTPLADFLYKNGSSNTKDTASTAKLINSLLEEAVVLRETYELLAPTSKSDDDDVIVVREKARDISSQLMIMADEHLDEGDQLVKYCFSGMLYMMMAAKSSSHQSIQNEAEAGETTIGKCLSRIEKVEDDAKGGDEHSLNLYGWIVRKNVKEWTWYNRAIVAAILAKNNKGSSNSWKNIGEHIDNVDSIYLDKHPIHDNPYLAWACQNLPKADAETCSGALAKDAHQ